MRRLLVLLVLLAVPLAASATNTLRCHEEEGTRKMMCVDYKAVSANGDIRAATLYTGGPNQIRRTNYTVVVNCAKNIATLQDASGVNFAGGQSSATPAMRDLADIICGAAVSKQSPKLRQF